VLGLVSLNATSHVKDLSIKRLHELLKGLDQFKTDRILNAINRFNEAKKNFAQVGRIDPKSG
jgi:hypothetical protein